MQERVIDGEKLGQGGLDDTPPAIPGSATAVAAPPS